MKKFLLTLLLGILSAPLLVSAVVYQPIQGGTGTSTKPSLGQILIGNTLGKYDLISSSSLLSNYVTYPYASSTYASTSWVDSTFVPYLYASSTYPSFTYASNTFSSISSGQTGKLSYWTSSSALGSVPTSSTSGYFLMASSTSATGYVWNYQSNNSPLYTTINGNLVSNSIYKASSTADGYLSSTDWTTFNNKGSGSVTSVDMSVPTGLSISGNPITTNGTLALTLTSGYNIPLTASTTNWNNLYDNVLSRLAIATTTSGTGWYVSTSTNSITLNIPVASASATGTLSATDWTTFNNKGSGTVTSVGLTVPTGYTAGSAVTTSGNLSFTTNTGYTGAFTTATGTTGTDFNISTTSSSLTINCPDSSATNRGCLTSTDWITFNTKAGTTSPYTAGYIPYATTSNALTNSSIYQLLGGKIGIGTTTPSSELTVIGTTTSNIFNISTTTSTSGYLVQNNRTLLHTFTPNTSQPYTNLFLGYSAGNLTMASTTASNYNVGIGPSAMSNITTGTYNTAVGNNSGITTTGYYNSSLGSFAGNYGTGNSNTAIGTFSQSNSNGTMNTSLGALTMQFTGDSTFATNTVMGYNAMGNSGVHTLPITGNIAIGANAAYNIGVGGAESDSLYIDNRQRSSSAVEKTESIIFGKMASASTSQTITFNTATTTMGAGATTNKVIFGSTGNVGIGTITPANKLEVAGAILLATSTANGLGVKTGEGIGGAVTQGTSKSTGVTLNRMTGQITMNNAALAGGAEAAFTLTNSYIASTDSLIVNVGATGSLGAYLVSVGRVSAGSASITLSNASTTSLSEAVVLNFFVLKGSAN